MPLLRTTEGTPARLLEMIALSVMRLEAVRQARFTEFDLPARLWTIPADRMKQLKKDHRIPLTDRMVEIIEQLQAAYPRGPFLFGGEQPIGEGRARDVLAELLVAIGHEGHVVPHGFRSSFKDFCHETVSVNVPAEVIEQALGHRIKDEVERAYRRGDLLERRKVLMGVWEDFCFGPPADGKVVQLRTGT